MTALIEPGRLAAVASDPVADALREWARRIIGASVGWGPEHGRPHLEELSELERQVLTLVHNAAATLSLLRQGLADDRDREWLERLVKVPMLPEQQVRGGVAVQIVTECAERRVPSMLGVTSPRAWARLCKAMLVAEADPAFERLKVEDVAKLLEGYKPASGGNPAGKLTPRVIVGKLYELIGDETVTEDSIAAADKRYRGRRAPSHSSKPKVTKRTRKRRN